MPEYSFTDEPIADPAGVSRAGQGDVGFNLGDYITVPDVVEMGARAAATAALGSPVGWGLKGIMALARADPTRAGWTDRLYNRELRDPYRKYIRDPLRALGILSTPQAEAAFGGYGTAEAETEGVAGIDTSGKTAYGGGEFSFGDGSWEKDPDQYTVTYDSDVADAAEAAAAAAAAASLDFDEDYGWGEDIDAEEDEESGFGESSDWNTGGFVTDNRQMPSGFRPLGYANGGSMGFRPIGAWSNGGPVVPPINIQSVANIPIQSVANIPIQSAANIPLAHYQPSTPYVYPDPPATPTPGTTPTGTENTFFAADPDKYTVPTPFSYGTTAPPTPPPGTTPPGTTPPGTTPPGTTPPGTTPGTTPDPWTPSPGWTIGADGNISLDENTAPGKYFSQDEEGEDVFDEQGFLQDAYNNQLFQGNTTHRIEEIVEEDEDGNEHSYFRLVRSPTTVAPPTVAPPTVAPPTVAPPTVAPPTVAPPKIAPPTVAPPTVAPPTVAPPTVAPPTVAPPTVAPPTWTPSPGWIRRPDGNISLDKASAPAKYWKQEDDDAGGDEWFDTQWFLQDAYNNKRLEKRLSAAGYRIDEIVEEDEDGNEHSYFRLVRAGGPNWNDGGFVQKSGLPYTQGGNAMPNVMGREFPYTPEGMAAAQQYRQAIGMRDGGMMGFRPIGMQTGGAAAAEEGVDVYKGLVAATQSKSPQKVIAYIKANHQALTAIALTLPPDQASFVQDALNSFAQAPEQGETLGESRGMGPREPDLNEMLKQFDKDTAEYDRLSKDPGFAMAEEERMAGGPRQRSFGSSAAPDHLLMPESPPFMRDPKYKGYFNPNQLDPFFNPNEIDVADGGYITRNMNRGGLMSLRRR